MSVEAALALTADCSRLCAVWDTDQLQSLVGGTQLASIVEFCSLKAYVSIYLSVQAATAICSNFFGSCGV